MALNMQSEQYQTCYFLGKSVAYVQIPMTVFSFPFGQYQEKNITGNVATILDISVFKKLCYFLNKDSPSSSKTKFFLILIFKKTACIKDA